MNFHEESPWFRRKELLDIIALLNAERILKWEEIIEELSGLQRVLKLEKPIESIRKKERNRFLIEKKLVFQIFKNNSGIILLWI